MFDENSYDRFRVVLEISAHSALNLNKDNLLTYIEHRLKMSVTKDDIALIKLVKTNIEKEVVYG